MAKKKSSSTSTALTAPGANSNSNLPAYLQDMESTGLEEAAQYIQPGRLKIIQKTTKAPLGDKFNPGTVVLQPTGMLLAEMPYDGAKADEESFEAFSFVPLLFYPEWLTTNKHGVDPFIVDRSDDPRSELARKAKTKNLRKETIDGKEVRHVEVLNFLIRLDHPEFCDLPSVITFSKGEHGTGSTFITQMRMRRAPIWSMRFSCTVGKRTNDDGDWYGFNIESHAEQPLIEEAHVPGFKTLHEELVAARQASRIKVDHEDADPTTVESSEY